MNISTSDFGNLDGFVWNACGGLWEGKVVSHEEEFIVEIVLDDWTMERTLRAADLEMSRLSNLIVEARKYLNKCLENGILESYTDDPFGNGESCRSRLSLRSVTFRGFDSDQHMQAALSFLIPPAYFTNARPSDSFILVMRNAVLVFDDACIEGGD